MEREAPNLSTECQPKGSGRNPSDTLDKAVSAQDKLARPTVRDPSKRSTGALLRNRRSRAEKLRGEQAVRDQRDADRRAEGLPAKTEPVSSSKN